MGYHLSNYERESIINFNVGDDMAELYTADPVWMRKMDKLTEANPEQFRLKDEQFYNGEVISKTYTLPKRFISIRSKERVSAMTEEQKEAARLKMAAFNKMRSAS